MVIKSKGKKVLISGDFIHHPFQFAFPLWKMDADVLPDQAVRTRRQLLTELADTGTMLIGSHFPNPVAGFVRKQDESFIFKA